MAIAAGTAEAIGPTRLLQGCEYYAEAQGLHIAFRCRSAAGIQAAIGPNQIYLWPFTAQIDYAKAGLALFRRP
jgi:hypothetical protein